ncbi:MAG: family 78 glycoside hydrolase catalytic domain, partial [Bacilli bacterium]
MKAKWIWKKTTTINDYAYFFKDVIINEKINNATIKISAHNHFKLFINKIMVSGFVSPVPTVADKEKAYLEYDIKDYLKIGENNLEIIVLYFGDYGQNYKKAYPGLWLDLNIITTKETINIVSDTSWKVYNEVPYNINMSFQQSRKITPIEKYDSRIVLDKDDYSNVVYSNLNDLKPLLTKQKLNEGYIYEEITPKFIKYENGISVFDVGKIISGFVRFSLKGYKDNKITIRYSENLDEEGFVGHNVANEKSDNYKDIYIMSGKEQETHQFDFTYKAFRFFQVEGYKKEVKKEEVTGLFAGTKLTIVKENKPITNDWRIDKLYEMFIQTQRNNTLGMLTDCPHREQAQYLGDSDIQLEAIETNILEAKDLMDKVLTDFMYEQFKDGTFPFVAPTNYVGRFKVIIPEYDLYYLSILKRRYEIDKDKEVLKKYLNTALKVINYSLSLKDSNGLLKKT